MIRKKAMLCITLVFLSLLLIPSFLYAQTEEYKDYTVIKGDTLWDISQKELGDPFLWPKVWKENPGIANPDRIYPKQKIKIPLYVLQKEVPLTEIPEAKVEKKEEPKKEVARKIEPLRKEYLVSKEIIMESGYIADSVHSVGNIVDSPGGRTILGTDDYAYIKTDNPCNVGEKFYVIRSAGKVTHPESGQLLGYLIEVLGIAEVVGQDNGATKIKIKESYSDIFTGNLLDTYYEIEPPFLTEVPRQPDINAYIVAAKELRVLNGRWDIVYIDKGENEGLRIGDLYAIVQGEHRAISGIIQIIDLRESTATAMVRKSSDTITKGDEVVGLSRSNKCFENPEPARMF
jgi:hypothetical protein